MNKLRITKKPSPKDLNIDNPVCIAAECGDRKARQAKSAEHKSKIESQPFRVELRIKR